MPAAPLPSSVVDTNIIVSSVISDKGAPRAVVEAWHAGRFTLTTCAGQIAEVSRALHYDRIRARYHLTDEDIRAVLALLWTQAEVVADPAEIPTVTGDQGDDLLLALCEASRADYFVTGDGPLLSLQRYGLTAIVSPREFTDKAIGTGG